MFLEVDPVATTATSAAPAAPTAPAVRMDFRRLLAEKELRENTRYAMTDIARATGLSRQAVYAWLNGNMREVRLDNLAAMCRFLDCRPGDLLVLDDGEQEAED